jgi:phosphoglycerate dehydrogenase-like enzyme
MSSLFRVGVAISPNLDTAGLMEPVLDVFEEEPLPTDHPLAQMDNVILAPHAMAWTDDMYRGNGVGACENVLAVLQGEVPKHTVNKDVVQRPGFQAKLRALHGRWTTLDGRG